MLPNLNTCHWLIPQDCSFRIIFIKMLYSRGLPCLVLVGENVLNPVETWCPRGRGILEGMRWVGGWGNTLLRSKRGGGCSEELGEEGFGRRQHLECYWVYMWPKEKRESVVMSEIHLIPKGNLTSKYMIKLLGSMLQPLGNSRLHKSWQKNVLYLHFCPSHPKNYNGGF